MDLPSRTANKIPMRPRLSYLKHQERMAYIFIIPPLSLYFIFSLLPMIVGIVLSFTEYDVIRSPVFVGMDNYRRVFQDVFFRDFLWNTIRYAMMFVPASFVASLGAALLLNRKKMYVSIFRTAFYLPVLCSMVAMATIWLWLLNGQHGAINTLLLQFGIVGPAWLQNTRYAMGSIVAMSVWAGFGGNMMIFLAGLQGVPDYLYEAARLDGASKIQEFVYVTIPGIGTTIFFVSTTLIIGSMQMFDAAFILTEGGPGNTTKTLVYYIYDVAFQNLRMGYASAMSVVLFLFIMIFSVINIRLNKESSGLLK
jgi:multiple sugar transport system permease protein